VEEKMRKKSQKREKAGYRLPELKIRRLHPPHIAEEFYVEVSDKTGISESGGDDYFAFCTVHYYHFEPGSVVEVELDIRDTEWFDGLSEEQRGNLMASLVDLLGLDGQCVDITIEHTGDSWIFSEEATTTEEPSPPPYPYDERTDTISLPVEVEEELRRLVATGGKVKAVKRVRSLTGAGLKVSKDYVDTLEELNIKNR
jgi:hypothetical protein